MVNDPPQEFLDVVKRIPPTWKCVLCEREFDNSPRSKNHPYGFTIKTEDDGQRVIDGNICEDCYKSN